MANVVFKIGDEKKQTSDIVYQDINYDAVIKLGRMPAKRNEEEWKSRLISEKDSEHFIKTEQSFGVQNPEPANILLYYATPQDYDQELRKWRLGESCKLSTNINIKAVQKSIENIFTWLPGERILLPEFGSKLRIYLYEGITPINIEQIKAEINQCILQWEPRVNVKQIVDKSTIDDAENNTVHLMIVYSIPAIDDNVVYQYDYSYTIPSS